MDDERKKKAADLRATLARFRGGVFSTGESGGASGMIFFKDPEGQLFFLGGLNQDNSRVIVNALNLTLELLG